jgi:hypothetical protein
MWGAIIGGLAAVAGAVISTKGNKDAAAIAAAASDREAQAIREGNEAAQKRYDELALKTAGGTEYLRRVVAANPNNLTDAQKQEMDDTRRNTTRSLNASGLRGAGRATVAAFRGVESDTRGRMVGANRTRSDNAAQILSGQYSSAVGNSANLDASTGKAVGAGHASSGLANANATTANASVTGKALGDIAGIIASEEKERGRDSRYKQNLTTMTTVPAAP